MQLSSISICNTAAPQRELVTALISSAITGFPREAAVL